MISGYKKNYLSFFNIIGLFMSVSIERENGFWYFVVQSDYKVMIMWYIFKIE